jgi:methylmalonyl-CoA mutase, C-terminal domain
MSEKKIRVLVAKPGLDGHDRGAKVIARMFRDAGYEVVYTGLHQTPDMVVNAAIQEDVDLLGLSIMSGAHNALVPAIYKLLCDRDAGDIPIVLGGIIPDADKPRMEAAGVKAIYTPGTSMEDILKDISRVLAERPAS